LEILERSELAVGVGNFGKSRIGNFGNVGIGVGYFTADSATLVVRPICSIGLISLVSKVSFRCKFFSSFQNDRDNGESTVGLLVLT